jgi:uncharacterized membrane protein YeaQ/YmgE (transglycosylase-associated protein family)
MEIRVPVALLVAAAIAGPLLTAFVAGLIGTAIAGPIGAAVGGLIGGTAGALTSAAVSIVALIRADLRDQELRRQVAELQRRPQVPDDRELTARVARVQAMSGHGRPNLE